jgi:hypothetical protein
MFGHKIYVMDVKTAFLCGEIGVETYMKPPIGFKCPKGAGSWLAQSFVRTEAITTALTHQ